MSHCHRLVRAGLSSGNAAKGGSPFHPLICKCQTDAQVRTSVQFDHTPWRTARPKVTGEFRQQCKGTESTRFPDAHLKQMPSRQVSCYQVP